MHPGIDQSRDRGTSQSLIRRSRRVLLALVVVLVAGGAGTAAAVFDGPGSASRADDPIQRSAVTSSSSTTTTTTTLPPTTAPPTTVAPAAPTPTTSPAVLSQPDAPPADPYAAVPVKQVGEIVIPKIGLDVPYYEGVWLTVIDVGPGHWPGTANAGGYGNMVLAGHRVTHSHPFRSIDQLVPGDDIVVRDATGSYTYKVTSSEVVTPDQLWIVDQKPGRTITLFACHPPGSATYRYVVHGQLVS